MKLMFHFDSYHDDIYSGRQFDAQTWFAFQAIWGMTELAIVNISDVAVSDQGESNINVYSNLNQFLTATAGSRYITLECPKHNPTEMLRNHTFDDTAWYCIGPTVGWQGNYISGSSTLGVEQMTEIETHSPFIGGILLYTRHVRGL